MDKNTLTFTGFVKGVTYQESEKDRECQIILGNDYANYLLTVKYENARDNITEKFNLSVKSIDKNDLSKLLNNNYYMPNSLIVEQIDINSFADINKNKHFSINGILSINKGNVMFFEQSLMHANFSQLENAFEMSSDDFEKYVMELHQINYEPMEYLMDDSKDNVDIVMDALETLEDIESDTRKPLTPPILKQINPIGFYKNER